jgi:hypothetical protein
MKTPFIRSRTIIPGRNTLETDHMPLPLLIETPPKTQNEVLGESSVTLPLPDYRRVARHSGAITTAAMSLGCRRIAQLGCRGAC